MDIFLQIADAIKKDISEILNKALQGDEMYRYEDDSIRWLEIESDIHKRIEYQLTGDALCR